MGEPSLQAVTVRLAHPGGSRAADREALLASAAQVTGVDPASTAVGRRCPHCGSDTHGRPWATVQGAAVGVSLSRTPGVLALAVGPVGIGVDVERVSRVAAAPLDASSPGERARYGSDPVRLAACWAATEAVLKRDGRGLRVDPASVDVDLDAGTAVLDGAVHRVRVRYLDDDVVLAVATDTERIVIDDRREHDPREHDRREHDRREHDHRRRDR
ncbi:MULTISPECIES: 4'-phosphopantetheinyl transferase family protein [unclassified Curtobacterium]|uniref:4'-phosphopantetheinyl transferase family protein n=1 Tax=unclassified Curtobacterium TaxID=257496 RepID=UPI00226B5DAF|nr:MULTISPECIES: 4'-phosphopantetheinyl transferase superfamily protein [unclassified Curtobacterium]